MGLLGFGCPVCRLRSPDRNRPFGIWRSRTTESVGCDRLRCPVCRLRSPDRNISVRCLFGIGCAFCRLRSPDRNASVPGCSGSGDPELQRLAVNMARSSPFLCRLRSPDRNHARASSAIRVRDLAIPNYGHWRGTGPRPTVWGWAVRAQASPNYRGVGLRSPIRRLRSPDRNRARFQTAPTGNAELRTLARDRPSPYGVGMVRSGSGDPELQSPFLFMRHDTKK